MQPVFHISSASHKPVLYEIVLYHVYAHSSVYGEVDSIRFLIRVQDSGHDLLPIVYKGFHAETVQNDPQLQHAILQFYLAAPLMNDGPPGTGEFPVHLS